MSDTSIEWTRGDDGMAGLGTIHLRDKKGGDESEWPKHLRVREFPVAEVA